MKYTLSVTNIITPEKENLCYVETCVIVHGACFTDTDHWMEDMDK